MKTWITYLAAIGLGLSATLLLGDVVAYREFLHLTVPVLYRLGIFMLFPVVFILFTSGIASLSRHKERGIVISSTLFWGLISSLLLTVCAAVSSLIFAPTSFQIPTVVQGISLPSLPLWRDVSELVVSHNAFWQLSFPMDSLIPLIIVSAIVGYSLKPDLEVIRPAYVVINSAAEAMLRVIKVFTIIGAFFLMIISAQWFSTVDIGTTLSTFGPLLLALGIILILSIGIVLPLLYLLFTWFKGGNPYRILLGALPAILASGFSGNLLYGVTPLMSLSQRNNGVRKRIAGVTIPLFTIIGRGGSAMVSLFVLLSVVVSLTGSFPSIQALLMLALFSSLFGLLAPFSPQVGVLFIGGIVGQYVSPELTSIALGTMVAILPIVHGIGLLLDSTIATLGAAYCSHTTIGKNRIEYTHWL